MGILGTLRSGISRATVARRCNACLARAVLSCLCIHTLDATREHARPRPRLRALYPVYLDSVPRAGRPSYDTFIFTTLPHARAFSHSRVCSLDDICWCRCLRTLEPRLPRVLPSSRRRVRLCDASTSACCILRRELAGRARASCWALLTFINLDLSRNAGCRDWAPRYAFRCYAPFAAEHSFRGVEDNAMGGQR